MPEPQKKNLRETIETVEETAETTLAKAQEKLEEGVEAVLKDVPPEKRKKRKKRRWYKHVDVNKGEKSFAAGMNIYKILWVFIFGCVIGVLWETLYVYFGTGEIQRRSGMLYGPFNQVYGFGAVLFSVILYRYRKKNGFIIFLASALLGMGFEYICSWVQQIMFGSTSWDYSDMPLNLGGRINLEYGIGWGIMGLLFLTHFWPWMSEMIERIPNTFGKTLTIAFTAFLALNLALSAVAVYREGERIKGSPPANFIEVWIDKVYPNEYMAKKYPSMTFKDAEGNTVLLTAQGDVQQELAGPIATPAKA
ncbi:putative ABC transporter permease [Ruminococcaceae bacterium OttesenSCG-928-A16]|nr:putative ABC transporter permease [Ruminococcaceae bacterium OttesenSCG-928-A16]